ncbi:alpha/beta hydrolase [Caenispirillum bisanense]|uniref:Phospholipase/carboxylesterase n=1 Tax=Caenispirillum bisanense TaxID=414052 RepID=A0A286G2Z9_9PROT|nr:alpha/beta fold hydrolase [Caenispirillum bisanense]SOD89895.1 phospholipase/carboxylesterase [Caenispirillum bisanense]
MPNASLTGPSARPADGAPPRRLVVLLHGYGADGNDLIGLAPVLARTMPDAAFHSPHAPFPCEMAPYGRQWFSLSAYDPDMLRRRPETMGPVYARMMEGAAAAAPTLDAYLEGLLEHYGLSDDRLVLVGFSQGTMMALHVALRRAAPCAAVVGFSGALLADESLAGAVTARPPVLLVHGLADEVVPPEAMGLTESALRGVGVTVESHGRPGLPHGIDEEGIALAGAFIARNAPPAA